MRHGGHSSRFKRVQKICRRVFYVFDTDRQADKVVADAAATLGFRAIVGMGGAGRMRD